MKIRQLPQNIDGEILKKELLKIFPEILEMENGEELMFSDGKVGYLIGKQNGDIQIVEKLTVL